MSCFELHVVLNASDRINISLKPGDDSNSEQ